MKKNKKRWVLMILVVVMIVSMATTAFAYWSNTASWSSSVCNVGFTTSGYITRDAGWSWEGVQTFPLTIAFDSPPAYDYLYATPRNTSGVSIAPKTTVYERSATGCYVYQNYYTTSYIKLRIDNPFPGVGNNMVSNGEWTGWYQ